ncbi:MAG: YidC/Oxa1 family membrane protein insertase [Clostridia bacterium]|jgi:YidC/Oxa1 family membrane protein insertase|nr:YidC/Oxa1 family membrane protein insertase [Clostridia bacterium]
MGFISELFGYILNWLYGLVSNYGLAIIIFSILLRVILIPITIKQQKSMKKSAKLQEKMAEIQKKYKNNPEKLNQETIELYKSEKMSPFSGCLTSILQLVIILSVFWLVSQPLTYMKRIDPQIIEKYTNEMKESEFNPNNSYVQISVLDYAQTKYQEIEEQLKQENVENREELEAKRDDYNQLRLNMEFLGIDLSKVPTQSLNDWRVYIIPGLYVITSFISIRLTTMTQTKKKKKKEEIIMENGEVKEEPDPMEQMQAMNKSMTYMMPIMSVMIAVIAPLGLALYWLMSNILMIIERLVINKIMESKEEKDEEEKANG